MVTAPAALAALPAALNAFGVAVLPVVHAYGTNPGALANAGRARHTNDGLPVNTPPNNEVTFPDAGNRRAYMCRFRTTGANPVDFDIYSHHAAPDSKYPDNVDGIRAFADVHPIGRGRVLPVLITGDFNCCNYVNPCPNKPNGHHLSEQNAQWQLTGRGVQNHAFWVETLAALRAACQATDAARVASASLPATVMTSPP